MSKTVDTIQKHWDGILAYWNSGKLTTAYLEGLNSVFSAVKRKARGFKNTDNLITMNYLVAADLNLKMQIYHSFCRRTLARNQRCTGPGS